MKLARIKRARPDSGYCWVADLPEDVLPGDSEDAPGRSPLRLFENGKELGPGHTVHSVIRETGRGTFSHWNQHIFFSTSDNTSPLANRREYVVVAPVSSSDYSRPDVAHGHPGAAAAGMPSNYAVQSGSVNKIKSDAEYALRIARNYADQLPGGKHFLKGKSILELGPGAGFATPMILAAWGAKRISVTDRFLVRFQPEYHIPLYREVSALLKHEDPAADTLALDRCVAAGEHDSDVIDCLECPIEHLPESGIQPFDIVLSNAVLEHVFDPTRAICSLFAVTLPGGFGFHQVDFRDHRNFSRPLEYLLLDEFSFMEIFHTLNGECGNRQRAHQFRAIFELAGFGSADFTANMWAEEAYLTDLVPRLRLARASPYADMDSRLLRELSGQFVVRRP